LNTPRDVSDAQNIADMLINTGEGSHSEPYWQQAAASITTGMILHICYAFAKTNRRASLADLAAVFSNPEEGFRDHLMSILAYEHDPKGERGWLKPNGRKTKTHPIVAQKVREMLNKEDKDFSGVLSAVVTPLALFADPLVAANTSASDFRVADLVDHERPISLYIVVPPSDMERLAPLVRIIFTIIVNRLTEKLDFEGAQQVTRNHRLLFLIDEFPSLKRMALFSTVLSYMAGFGLKAYLISQDICQIEDNYGQNQSIVSNCQIRIAFAPNNQKTANLLSEMTGTRTIERSTVSYSGNRGAPTLSGTSVAVAVEHRPLLTSDEVGRIKPPRKAGEGAAERIVEPGDMLIFSAGHYPIYGTQMLYFADPELSRRANIAPPTQMIRIMQDGTVCDQLPITRTEHVLSPPEIMPTVQESLLGEEDAGGEFWIK
jgi:type IV secretion system protein VirD4